jgi:hypothetical protein
VILCSVIVLRVSRVRGQKLHNYEYNDFQGNVSDFNVGRFERALSECHVDYVKFVVEEALEIFSMQFECQ